MKPRLFVHIGGPKCGSSAIQAFLKNNKKALLQQGYAVPTANFERRSRTTGDQVGFYKSLIGNEDAPRVMRKKVSQLLETVKAKTATPSVITSAENLSSTIGCQRFFEELREDFDLKIIAYIRRQDDFLMSGWQQWSLKQPIDFWAWLTRVVGSQGNWFAILEPWREVYGKENMAVRLFEKDKLFRNDLLHDFCHLIDADEAGLDFDIGTENPTYSIAVQEFADNAHHLFENAHDNKFYLMIEDLTGSRFHKDSNASFLTHAQRDSIMLRYKQCNKKIKETYFTDDDQSKPLFAPIKPNVSTPSREQIQKEKEALIAHLIYEIYKRSTGSLDKTATAFIKENWPGRQ